MKLLTLNTHSLIEENYESKLFYFVDVISEIKPDIIALQEVNQTTESNALSSSCLEGCINPHFEIKEDNHIASVNSILRLRGIDYNWAWIPIKNGYKKFDEGVGILSLSPIIDIKTILLSKKDDYNNWRTRKALGIKTNDNRWFYSVHFGWWDDELEPFQNQWERFLKSIDYNDEVWVLGDFNATPGTSSYKLVTESNWYDCYELSLIKDGGITVSGKIAGWSNDSSDKRIDYIFTNKRREIRSSNVIFNGKNKAVISDHFGVLTEI